MLSKRKKIIVLVVMFALLVATAVLNYTLTLGASGGTSSGDGDVISTGNFFTGYRSERLTARNQQIAELNEIIALEGDEFAEQRAQAADTKMRLVSILELETTLENVLKAHGYEDAVVTIGLLSDNCNVVVSSENELDAQQCGQIYTLIYEEAQIAPDYVRIIPV